MEKHKPYYSLSKQQKRRRLNDSRREENLDVKNMKNLEHRQIQLLILHQ